VEAVRRKTMAPLLAAGAVLAAVMAGPADPALATLGGPPQLTPVSWTPQLYSATVPTTTAAAEQVRQLVQCGSTMYAVGRFTQIQRSGTIYSRNNAFSFSATDGTVTSWNPNVNGQVNSVALSPDCSVAYLGGQFTAIGSTTVKNIAAVSTATGLVLPAFASKAGGKVEALLSVGGHVLAGGFFTGINGSSRGYMASLNPTTGLDDGYVDLNISGHYVYVGANGVQSAPNNTQVYNYSLSPDGTKLLVTGDFMSVGGQGRQQIFMLDLGPSQATLDPWYSPEFNNYCAPKEPFYLQDASWSADMSTIYTAATGFIPASGPGSTTSQPRAQLCDAAAAFPSTSVPTNAHLWVNYTGCDSLYSTAADGTTAYFAGHERWANNGFACNHAGPGSVSAQGVVGLNPATGAVTYNPTRGRGLGADEMVVTSAGLWIGSDNFNGTDTCGGVHGHAGICFLPY
jgi:hypothetical protein